ncbi:hypothetical protein QFZ42_002168 [Variovorax paradoxus]|uniref:DUF3540 domain-containing protein n=1 Tax=Variovorax paradoxus TaxID=34073 RepID=UPI0027911414|nr:DUF3540 domain-containing protein [Variovorax paradoxus]MDQ0570334.1 hypothetical protein [Variovorax paradoxus]
MTMAAHPSSSAAPAAPLASRPTSELEPLLRKNAPAQRQPAPAVAGISMATVVACDPDSDFCDLQLADGQPPLRCRRAASCLLVPAPGDTVMVAGPSDGALYVIAVVAQADKRQATLSVDGDLRLQSKRGAIAIRSAGTLDLHSDTAMATSAPEWKLTAERGQCNVSELDYRGAELRFSVLVTRFLGRACEVVLDRFHLLTRSSFRVVEEAEHVRAGHIDIQASQTLRLHAKNTLVTSKELVKVDAEQIHMG